MATAAQPANTFDERRSVAAFGDGQHVAFLPHVPDSVRANGPGRLAARRRDGRAALPRSCRAPNHSRELDVTPKVQPGEVPRPALTT